VPRIHGLSLVQILSHQENPMPRTIPLLLILVCATSFAQPVTTPTAVPVTSWLDGNPSPTDGVPHGNGFQGAAGIWTPFSNQLWPSVLTYQPFSTFGTFDCGPTTHSLTGDQSSLIPITDPDNHLSWYILGYSPFYGEPPYRPTTDAIRDPLGGVVNFWNGSYDAQQFLIYLSNGNLIGCVNDCDQYRWGTNFGGVIAWPETNPQRLYWFFAPDRNDVDHGRGSHLIGVSNPPVTFQRHNCQADGLWEAKFFTDPCPHVRQPDRGWLAGALAGRNGLAGELVDQLQRDRLRSRERSDPDAFDVRCNGHYRDERHRERAHDRGRDRIFPVAGARLRRRVLVLR